MPYHFQFNTLGWLCCIMQTPPISLVLMEYYFIFMPFWWIPTFSGTQWGYKTRAWCINKLKRKPYVSMSTLWQAVQSSLHALSFAPSSSYTLVVWKVSHNSLQVWVSLSLSNYMLCHGHHTPVGVPLSSAVSTIAWYFSYTHAFCLLNFNNS